MRRSRFAIVTVAVVALIVLAVLIVRYGLLGAAPASTASDVTHSATSSVASPSALVPTVSAVPGRPTSPAASSSPSASEVPAPTVTANRRTVDVVVTYLDWSASDRVVEAGAYATAVEQPGSCTLTLTSGGQTVTSSIPALTDASTMSCGGITVPRERLSSGTWTAVVIYESATSVGTSAPIEVVIP